MKTVVLWNTIEDPIKFFITEKNVDHLDKKYVNSTGSSIKEEEEIMQLTMVNQETGEYIPLFDQFPVQEVYGSVFKVVEMGFIP